VKPRERTLAALHFEEPDLLPIFELAIAPRISKSLLGRTPLYSNEPLILKLVSDGVPRRKIEDQIVKDVCDLFHHRLKHDVIAAGMSESSAGSGVPGMVKGYDTFLALNAQSVRALEDSRWEIDGRRFRHIPETNLMMPEPQIAASPENVEEYLATHSQSKDCISEADLYQEKSLIESLGDSVAILGGIGELGTFHTWEINHLLRWLYTHPTIVRKLVEYDAIRSIENAKVKLEIGIDICFLDCDWGTSHGPFMSPRHFKEIWLPALKSVVDAVHKRGGFVIAHSDGDIMPLLEDIVDSGMDGLHSIQASAGMDIARIKRDFGDRISLWGNIDIAYPLTLGTVHETAEATRKCIDAASRGGGHVLCSSNSISQNVKLDNYLAMVSTARSYGKYPISRTAG